MDGGDLGCDCLASDCADEAFLCRDFASPATSGVNHSRGNPAAGNSIPLFGKLHRNTTEGGFMSAFTEVEISFLKTQRLGRLATVGANGQPHVVPVGFRYNPKEDTIDIGGAGGFAKQKKYRDVAQNPRVAFVTDDVPSVDPWTVRGIEIRGQAEILTDGGKEFGPSYDPEMFRIRPSRIISWGINSKDFYQQSARSVT